MNICDKCGAIIPFAGGSCPKCAMKPASSAGPFQSGAQPGGFGSQPWNRTQAQTQTPAPAQNGSAALIKKMERYKELLSENEELKAMIKPQNNFPTTLETNFQKRSFIKYFWPFLAGGVGAASVVYFVVALIIVLSTPSAVRYAQGYNMGDAYAGYIVAIIIGAVIIFFGAKIAKKKQAEFNNNAEMMNREMAERYNKGLENQRMIDLFQKNLGEMKQYEQLVPQDCRTSDKVSAIIEVLKEGRAESIEDACILI